jgi:hypothetical protein
VSKFKLGDKVFITGLGVASPLEGAVGNLLSFHEYAPGLYKHIIFLETVWWTDEYRAVEIPAQYLRLA